MKNLVVSLRPSWWPLSYLLLLVTMVACVDPEELMLRGTVDVIVVDGTITNLAEAQIITLNRSKADPLTGRFGSTPITKARVEVVIDSGEVVVCHETVDGSYQLPNDFKGRVGHAYQLRFTLTDGTRYVSNQQVMPTVSAIDKVSSQFNRRSLSQPILDFYAAGHDVSIDTQDPADQHNYYRWDWTLYEPQEWCKTCLNGFYNMYSVIEVVPPGGFYKSGTELYEDCFTPVQSPSRPTTDFKLDYPCRTKCWEIIHSYAIDVFDDQLTNGGLISNRKVAEIPFYQHSPCLVEIRQTSLTKEAYRYYKLFQDQTQNTGGLADTPPTALAGNVHNAASAKEVVIGYFTASAVFVKPHYIDRKDTEGIPFGASDAKNPPQSAGEELFYALYFRLPILEPEPANPNSYRLFVDNTPRPPTAVCAPSDSKTPYKPVGWPD